MDDETRACLGTLQGWIDALRSAEGFYPGAEGFRIGSTRLFEKLVSHAEHDDEYHLHQRDEDGTESDLTGARSLQGIPISETDPTTTQILGYNATTNEWTPTAAGAAAAHKDTHDPQDGADALDCAAAGTIAPDASAAEGSAHSFARSDHTHANTCAAASEIAGVQAAAEGSASSFARSDHAHQIQHAITDNHLATIDGTTNAPANLDYAKWTTLGLEGKTYAQLRADINVADGADVTGDNAPQAHKASHENTGGDEISVTALSGLLADDQHVLDAEAIAAVEGEATLDLTGDVTVAAGKTLSADTLREKTATGGVTIDDSAEVGVQGTLIKDNVIYPRKDKTNAYLVVNASGDFTFTFDTGDAFTYDISANLWTLSLGATWRFKVDGNNSKVELAYPLDMNSNKITELTAGAASGEAVEYDQLHAQAHGPSDHTGFANWKVVYTDGSGDQQELALGADGTFLQSGGAATLPEFTALVVGDIPDNFLRNDGNDTTSGTVTAAGFTTTGIATLQNVAIDSTPGDDTVSGITAEFTAGTNLVWGNFCYIGADGKMEKALATAEATSRVVAFCTETISENSTGTFLLHGFIRDDSAYNFTTIGAKIYLSDDTAGALDLTQPAGTDETVVILGIALTADVLYFNPTAQAIVEHT